MFPGFNRNNTSYCWRCNGGVIRTSLKKLVCNAINMLREHKEKEKKRKIFEYCENIELFNGLSLTHSLSLSLSLSTRNTIYKTLHYTRKPFFPLGVEDTLKTSKHQATAESIISNKAFNRVLRDNDNHR